MDKLEGMRVFVEVVNQQGFAAAGRQLGLSRGVVNNLIIRLEKELGIQLLQRTTRQVSPTDAGRSYYERCLNILADVEEAEFAITQLHAEPKGTLKINAPMSFGTMYLGSAIAAFMLKYPELLVQLTLSDRFVDPIAEGFDLTVRISQQARAEGLVTEPIAPIELAIAASPKYLEKRGIPTNPQELKHHDCLHYGQLGVGLSWPLFDQYNKPISAAITPHFSSNNGEILVEAAIQGLGIVRLPTFFIKDALKTGEIQCILQEYKHPTYKVYVGYAPNRFVSVKIQLLTDFLKQWFQLLP